MSIPKSPLLRKIREVDKIIATGPPPPVITFPLKVLLKERDESIERFERYCADNKIKFEVE